MTCHFSGDPQNMVAQAAWNWWKFEDAGKKLAHTLETRRSWVLCPPRASSYLDGAFVMERKVRRSKNTIALCKPSNKFISFPALVAWSSGQNLFGPTKQKVYKFCCTAICLPVELAGERKKKKKKKKKNAL